MDKFLFPLNYKYNTKLFGIIEYNILIPILIYTSIIVLLLYIFKIDFFISFGIVILATLPPLLLLSTKLNGQPPLSYFRAIIMYSVSQKVYVYGKKHKEST